MVEPFIHMVFDALQPRVTAVDACERVLLGHVLSADVKPGGQLPSERELAERLGVDRGTLRPAIARLVSRGLLSQRQGRGTIVLDIADSGGLDLLAPVIAQATADNNVSAVRGIARELLRLRRHLAAALLERVVEAAHEGVHIGDAAIAAVDAAIAALADACQIHGLPEPTDANLSALTQADVAVLRAVVVAVSALDGGLVFALAHNPVRQGLAACPPLQRAIALDLSESVLGWSVVAAFLRAPSEVVADAIVAGLKERDARTLARLSGPAEVA
jgi:DNA-binding FadR family transcriptional regulator